MKKTFTLLVIASLMVSNVQGQTRGTDESKDYVLRTLTFEDKDGDNNGGEFVKKTVEIPLVVKTPGTDGNFKGTYFAGDVEVVMVSKNVEMNPDSGLAPQGNGN